MGCFSALQTPYEFNGGDADGGVTLDRCPMSFLQAPDPTVHDVVDTFADREMGAVNGWPDAYAGAVVEGVRYLAHERAACEAEEMDRQIAESKRGQHG